MLTLLRMRAGTVIQRKTKAGSKIISEQNSISKRSTSVLSYITYKGTGGKDNKNRT